MVELDSKTAHRVAHLFAHTPLTLARSFLDGCMGRGWADDAEAPTCAQITVADFIFVAGNHTAPDAEAFVRNLPQGSPVVFFGPENDAWAELVERCHSGRAQPFTRYAFHHNASFDVERLQEYKAALPSGYSLAPIDDALYRQCLASPLQDLCSQFAGPGDYKARGLGFCAVKDGAPAGGASSYTVYHGGIEIEVDTLEAHRRKGIATACSAALILECLARGIAPAWDAANLSSKTLAEKLGYRFSHAYTAYEVKAPAEEQSPPA